MDAKQPTDATDAPATWYDQGEFDRLFAESKLKNQETKRTLIECLLAQRIQVRSLMAKAQLGPLTGDEHRAVCSSTNGIKRMIEALDLSTAIEEEKIELF